MYLSELYGRIGQILREHGDMQVVRRTSLKLDGIISSNKERRFAYFHSGCFNILEDYKQIHHEDDSFEEVKIDTNFVIDIP